MPPSHRFEDATRWRITHWGVDRGRREWADGDWALRAHVPVPATTVAEHVPEPLRPWVRRMTEEGAAWLNDLKDTEPQFAGDAQRLRTELEDRVEVAAVSARRACGRAHEGASPRS